MKWTKKILLLVSLLFSSIFSKELTEKSVLLLALQNKNSLKIIAFNRDLDSLSLQETILERYPKLSLSFKPSLLSKQPENRINSYFVGSPPSTLYDTVPPSPEHSIGSKIELSQKIPGGGELKGAIIGSVANIGKSRNLIHNSNYSLVYTQPIIKNAWKWGELNHSYKIATMLDKELSFKSKKDLLRELTDLRELYWSLYEKKATLSFNINLLQRSEDLLQIEKVRIKIGESTILDSLNAALNVLSAQQTVMDANIDYETALNTISASLALSADTIWLEDSIDLTINDLPDDTTLLFRMEQYDPSLEIFQTITERLCLEHEKIRQNFYPDLSFDAEVNHSRSGDRFLSTKEKSTSNAILSLVLSYSFPTTKYTISQAKSRYEFQKNELSFNQYRLDILSKLQNMKMAWSQELNRLQLRKEIITLSKRQYNVALEHFKLGQISRIELSEANNNLVKNESDYLKSRIQMKNLEIIIDELTGTMFEKFSIIIQ